MQTTEGVVLPGERAPVTVNVDRWRAGLPPDAWPDGLPASGEIWRRDVFAVAEAYRAGVREPTATADRRAGLGLRPYRVRPVARRQVARRRSERQTPGVRAGGGVHPAPDEEALLRRTAASATPTTLVCPGWGRACARRSSTSRLPARGGRGAAPDPRPCRGRPTPARGGCRPPQRLVVRGVAGLSALGGRAGSGQGSGAGRGGDGCRARPVRWLSGGA